jgi:hypothetical protein
LEVTFFFKECRRLTSDDSDFNNFDTGSEDDSEPEDHQKDSDGQDHVLGGNEAESGGDQKGEREGENGGIESLDESECESIIEGLLHPPTSPIEALAEQAYLDSRAKDIATASKGEEKGQEQEDGGEMTEGDFKLWKSIFFNELRNGCTVIYE